MHLLTSIFVPYEVMSLAVERLDLEKCVALMGLIN